MSQSLSQLTSNVTQAIPFVNQSAILAVCVHPDDNVAVALSPLPAGSAVHIGDGDAAVSVTLTDDIPAGHKIALRAFSVDDSVVKYGLPIGRITTAVNAGGWVHSHNLSTRLTDAAGYERRHHSASASANIPDPLPTFDG